MPWLKESEQGFPVFVYRNYPVVGGSSGRPLRRDLQFSGVHSIAAWHPRGERIVTLQPDRVS